ncbi:hypothetical protein GCM10011583_56010 [Streptomyces camponoticapitis]|uniref:Transposase IS110-like N-terminal domain-containing protein n=1 Tax=Streptomyces camponoticapitis TaxID=1616125 RepID=A0ABQ2EME1_9ACTN|nr:hypothetical protein GCM10011583_56010 [Streptomyces camponoticapitis]
MELPAFGASNTEPKLRELFAKHQARHGTVLVVVDRSVSIGALPLAVARDMGNPVACLPSLTMRQIVGLYPGEAKTDARDAFITRAPLCLARRRANALFAMLRDGTLYGPRPVLAIAPQT